MLSNGSASSSRSLPLQIQLSYFTKDSVRVDASLLDELIAHHYDSIHETVLVSFLSLNKERTIIGFQGFEHLFDNVEVEVIEPILELQEIYLLVNRRGNADQSDDSFVKVEIDRDSIPVDYRHNTMNDTIADEQMTCHARSTMSIQDCFDSVLNIHVIVNGHVSEDCDNEVDNKEEGDCDADMDDTVSVKITCLFDGKVLNSQKELTQFACQCYSSSTTGTGSKRGKQKEGTRVKNTESVLHCSIENKPEYTTEETLSLVRSRDYDMVEEDILGQLFIESCWSQDLLESTGMALVVDSNDKLFWFFEENGMCCSLVYPLKSANYPKLKTIHIIVDHHHLSGIKHSPTNLFPDAYVKSIARLFRAMKKHPVCSQLFLSGKQAKTMEASSNYVPIIADSIQEICQLSTNQDFVMQCLQLLKIDSVSSISEAIQQKLREKLLSTQNKNQ